MELDDLDYDDVEDVDVASQREALMKDEYLAKRLRGTVRLVDDISGDELGRERRTLMQVPYLTERGTFINNGSEWGHIMQARLLAGAYSRRQDNGELETQLNVRHGTGTPFRVRLEPETAQFRMKVGGSNLHLYSLLKDLGVPDEDLSRRWGPELFARNAKKYDARVIGKAYKNLVSRKKQQELNLQPEDNEGKAAAIKQALQDSRLHADAVARTLPGLLGGKKSASAMRRGWSVRASAWKNIEFDPNLQIAHAGIKVSAVVSPWVLRPLSQYSEEDITEALVKIASASSLTEVLDDPGIHSMFHSDSPLNWCRWLAAYEDGRRDLIRDEYRIAQWKAACAGRIESFHQTGDAESVSDSWCWGIQPHSITGDEQEQMMIVKAAGFGRLSEMADESMQVAPLTSEEAVVSQGQPNDQPAPEQWMGAVVERFEQLVQP